MIEQQIMQALQQAAIAARDASSIPTMAMKMIGRTGPDVPSQRYLELVQIVNNRTGDYWGNERVYQGVLRIILHWETNDEGAYPPTTYLDEIAGYFTKEKAFGPVKIYDVPDFAGVIETGAELLYPLSLRYRSFAA